MRLIDILNKIVNDELEDGTKVIYQGMEFVYDGKDLACVGDFDIYFYIDDKEDLKEVVEVIEPDDDVKKVETTDNTKIEELDGYELTTLSLFYKINEIIRYINKED
jgi:hypothetical protein